MYSAFIGRPVRVRITDNSEFRGVSVAIDAYLNISLESVHDCSPTPVHYSSLFIKGSYVDHVALDM